MAELLYFLQVNKLYFPLILFLFFVVRYFFLSYLVYIILWKLFPKKLQNRRIQAGPVSNGQIFLEIKDSLISFIFMALFLTPLFFIFLSGQTAIYLNWQDKPLYWIPLAVLIFFFWHDIYFYFSHRLLHKPWFFKNIHWVHHQSKIPTPCASHSFHWAEAILQILFIYPVVIWVPMHPWTFVIYMALTHFFATWGHFNYELMPYKAWDAWWGSWVTTSTHHNHHHEKIKGNFGLYLKCWDVRLNTLLQKTNEHFQNLNSR
jgi:sterol desaturase/sphingolipid hydroxylase (fatty acid hydroxylase superfamily)